MDTVPNEDERMDERWDVYQSMSVMNKYPKERIWWKGDSHIIRAAQRWKTCSFSWDVPVRTVTQLTFVANALCGYYISTTRPRQKKGNMTNIMKGIIAIATHPLLVAKGALCPMFMFGHWYGCFEKRRARCKFEWEMGRKR